MLNNFFFLLLLLLLFAVFLCKILYIAHSSEAEGTNTSKPIRTSTSVHALTKRYFVIYMYLFRFVFLNKNLRKQLQLAAVKTTFDFVISDSVQVKMICRTGQYSVHSVLQSRPCQSTFSNLNLKYGLTMLMFSWQQSSFQQDTLLHQKVHFHNGTAHATISSNLFRELSE